MSECKLCPVCSKPIDKPKRRLRKACSVCYEHYRRAYSIWHTAKYRSKKYNREFDLDINWILDRLNKCEVTGLSFELDLRARNYKGRHTLSPSIDRINSSKDIPKITVGWLFGGITLLNKHIMM